MHAFATKCSCHRDSLTSSVLLTNSTRVHFVPAMPFTMFGLLGSLHESPIWEKANGENVSMLRSGCLGHHEKGTVLVQPRW